MEKINTLFNSKMELFIKLFLVLNPFIDLLTSLCIHVLNINLTIGIIFRFIFMLICIYYLLFINSNKLIKGYIVFLIFYILLYSLNILSLKSKTDFIYDLKQVIKVFYFPVILITFYKFFDRKDMNKYFKLLIKVLCIYLVFLIIPILTNTGFKSYSITKSGTVGWFNSANEIGGVLSILSVILITFLYKKNNLFLKIIISICYIISILKIGTKVPMLSILIVLFMSFLYFMFSFIKNKEYKKLTFLFSYLIILVTLFILLLPKTTFYKNIETHLEFLQIDSVEELTSNIHYIDHFVFSERVTFYKQNKLVYDNSSVFEKLLGIGYIDDNNLRKLVEMDYYDVFFCHGIIGFIIFIIPLIIILFKNIKNILLNINFDKYMLITSSILILVLSLFSGHIITTPTVSIFSSLLIVMLINYKEVPHEDRCSNCKL